MFCKKCGQRVKDTENVCGKCGAVNQSAYYPKFTEDLCYCPECGRQASREDKFCTKCGAKLDFASANVRTFAAYTEKKEMKAEPLSRWSYMPHFDNFAPAEEEKPTEEQPQPKAEEENKEAFSPVPPVSEEIKSENAEPSPMEEAPAEEVAGEPIAPMQEEIADDGENISGYGAGIAGGAIAAHGYRQEAVPEREVPTGESALHRAPASDYEEPKRSVQPLEGISAESEADESFKNISENTVPVPKRAVIEQPALKQEIIPDAKTAEEPAVKEELNPAAARAEEKSKPTPAVQPIAEEKPARAESAKPHSFAAPAPEQKAAAQSKPYYNEIALDKRKDLENYSEPEKKEPAHMPLKTDVIATKPREYKDRKGFGIAAIIFAILLPPLGIVLGILAISRGWTTMNKSYSRLGTIAIIIGVVMTVAFSFIAWKVIIPAIEDYLKTIS